MSSPSKDEINVPIALGAFRDKVQSSSVPHPYISVPQSARLLYYREDEETVSAFVIWVLVSVAIISCGIKYCLNSHGGEGVTGGLTMFCFLAEFLFLLSNRYMDQPRGLRRGKNRPVISCIKETFIRCQASTSY